MAAAPASTTRTRASTHADASAPSGRKPTPEHLEPNKILVAIGVILMLGALFIAFGIPALGAVEVINIPSWSAAVLALPAIGVGILSCCVFKKAGPHFDDRGLRAASKTLKKMKEVDSEEEETQRLLDTHGIDHHLPNPPRRKKSSEKSDPLIPADSSADKVEELE